MSKIRIFIETNDFEKSRKIADALSPSHDHYELIAIKPLSYNSPTDRPNYTTVPSPCFTLHYQLDSIPSSAEMQMQDYNRLVAFAQQFQKKLPAAINDSPELSALDLISVSTVEIVNEMNEGEKRNRMLLQETTEQTQRYRQQISDAQSQADNLASDLYFGAYGGGSRNTLFAEESKTSSSSKASKGALVVGVILGLASIPAFFFNVALGASLLAVAIILVGAVCCCAPNENQEQTSMTFAS